MRQEATLEELEIGDHITVWLEPDGHCGRGGELVATLSQGGVQIKAPNGEVLTFFDDEISHFDVDRPMDATECLDYPRGDCAGPVDMWYTSGSRSWPRCTKHGEERLEQYERSMERYADSDVVPDWFDPDEAGERWGGDY